MTNEIIKLPRELVDHVFEYLDNKHRLACRRAHTLFHVESDELVYTRRRNMAVAVAMYNCATRIKFPAELAEINVDNCFLWALNLESPDYLAWFASKGLRTGIGTDRKHVSKILSKSREFITCVCDHSINPTLAWTTMFNHIMSFDMMKWCDEQIQLRLPKAFLHLITASDNCTDVAILQYYIDSYPNVVSLHLIGCFTCNPILRANPEQMLELIKTCVASGRLDDVRWASARELLANRPKCVKDYIDKLADEQTEYAHQEALELLD